jgi:hypothetical protein
VKEWALDYRSVVIRYIGLFCTISGAIISVSELQNHVHVHHGPAAAAAALSIASGAGTFINEIRRRGTRNTTDIISLSSDDPQIPQVLSSGKMVD